MREAHERGTDGRAGPLACLASAAAVIDQALAILRDRRELDFTDYRRSTVERRLANHMLSTGVRGDDYIALLHGSDAEVDRLAATLTIKVSRFYRNAAVFDSLRERVIPDLRERFAGEPLRVWSAGCAGGEEAYTLAMLLDASDAICATDIDERALRHARAGRYGADSFAELPEPLARTLPAAGAAGGAIALPDALRRRVAFIRHDLTSGTPPAALPYHLICCRNVLIYFTSVLQRRAVGLLAGSLMPGGILCLGEAEWTLGEPSLEVVDRKLKIFRRTAGPEVRR